MPSLVQFLFLPVAVAANLLAIECGTYALYGKSTYKPGKVQRLPYKLVMLVDVVLLLTGLIAPWVILFTHGLAAANLAFIGLSVLAALVINLLGVLIEWVPALFIDAATQLRLMRELPPARAKAVEQTIAEWPTLDAEAREGFRRRHLDMPIHIREAVFAVVLDDFPAATSDAVAPEHHPPLTTERLRHWAGAHLFNHVDAVLDMRQRLNKTGVFEGKLCILPDLREFPEGAGPIRFARVADDLFALGPLAA